MWTVSKKDVVDLLKLDGMARLREAQEKTALFEQTCEKLFEDFEHTVLHGDEDVGRWDDYIEWKAYREVQHDLEQKIKALRRGDFEVA
jgi:hypothetical protein